MNEADEEHHVARVLIAELDATGKQAVAIALSEASRAGAKIPKKKIRIVYTSENVRPNHTSPSA